MSDETDELRDIFLSISDDGKLTEQQQEGPSHAAFDAENTEEDNDVMPQDGLQDAVDVSVDPSDME